VRLSDPNPSCPRKPPPEKVKSIGSEDVVGEIEVASCGGPTKKVMSRTTFHLKGGGWEKDGYG